MAIFIASEAAPRPKLIYTSQVVHPKTSTAVLAGALSSWEPKCMEHGPLQLAVQEFFGGLCGVS